MLTIKNQQMFLFWICFVLFFSPDVNRFQIKNGTLLEQIIACYTAHAENVIQNVNSLTLNSLNKLPE